MKWIVSVEFASAIQYHKFFSLINLGRIRDTVLVNYNHTYRLIKFETTTKPEEDKIKKMGKVVNVLIFPKEISDSEDFQS